MESQTLTNSSPSEQPETVASTGARVIAVQANLVTIEAAETAQRPLTMNEVVCIVPQRETTQYQERLKAEVLRVRGREADAQVFESTRGVGIGDRAEQTGELLSVTLGPGLLGRVYDGLQNSLPDLSASYGNFLPRGVIAPALDLKKNGLSHLRLTSPTVSKPEIRSGRCRKAGTRTKSWFLSI
jgi:vacuolar-type H+-ATPase catalytic subunit A/Vma1